jgi:hypothetical protein
MKVSQLIYTLVTFATVVTATEDSDNHIEIFKGQGEEENEDQRNLQLGSGICQVVSDAIFPDGFSCDCGIALLAGNITIDCKTDRICSPGKLLCARIGVNIVSFSM